MQPAVLEPANFHRPVSQCPCALGCRDKLLNRLQLAVQDDYLESCDAKNLKIIWWKYASHFLVDFLYTTGQIFRLKRSQKDSFPYVMAPAQLQQLRPPMTNRCNSGL